MTNREKKKNKKKTYIHKMKRNLFFSLNFAEYQLNQPPPQSNWWPAGGGVKCV